MIMRPQRRQNLVVWRQSGAADQGSPVTPPSRTRPMRKWVRIGMLLTVLRLLPLGRFYRDGADIYPAALARLGAQQGDAA